MDLKKLVDLDDVSLNLDAVHPESGEKVKDVFCGSWPVAKKRSS